MTSVNQPHTRGVHLVVIAEIDTMKIASKHECHRCVGTVTHTAIKLLLLILVGHFTLHILSPRVQIRLHQEGRLQG